MSLRFAKIAVPLPLNPLFDYALPPQLVSDDIKQMENLIGARALVPFGRQKLVGIIVALDAQSDIPAEKVRPIIELIDTKPLLPLELFNLVKWASRYYQYPLGDALSVALPNYLRSGKAAEFNQICYWQLTELGRQHTLGANAHLQRKAQSLLQQGPLAQTELQAHKITATTLQAMAKKQLIQATYADATRPWLPDYRLLEEKPQLNVEQALAVATIHSASGFGCYLLEGVTGSGKTEVYLTLLETCLAAGKQALILVPEIGLTPQTINRFKRRFNVPISLVHSGLNDTERFHAWLAARENQAGIIIGTRSALFAPCAALGIIIIDEEHDTSYKQQDSLRYHARDLAVLRARENNIPIVLGSATPSLESLHNALSGKYHHLTLTSRAGNATFAEQHLLDIRGQYLESGLSAPLLAAMREHLEQGSQVMLFLNRRGYSPAMMCHQCGWVAECPLCERYYTLHHQQQELRCHHCDSRRKMPPCCPNCHSHELISVGVGTEQLEACLAKLFPEFNTVRIDRDNTKRKGALADYLQAIKRNEYQILIGTQILAKGHHFPNVTLVALIDVDSSLFSSDFRAKERLAQLFVQVAGRAGRASKQGVVLLQTHHPEDPLLNLLVQQGYGAFARSTLTERQAAQLPPFSYLALFQAAFEHSEIAEYFLRQVKQILEHNSLTEPAENIQTSMLLGPAPAPIAKRAGKYRWQLLFQAPSRPQLQRQLHTALKEIALLPHAKRVRWSIDIEPQDMS